MQRIFLVAIALVGFGALTLAQDGEKKGWQLPENAKFTVEEASVLRIVGITKDAPIEFQIAGALRVPTGEKPEAGWPAVLFISGSGSQERNGFAGGLDSGTWELLDALANAGYMVLSTDDRGAGNTPLGEEGVDPTTIGYDELVGDARAALQFLKVRDDVNGKNIFIIGHSEGGITAPILAGEEEDVAGVVFMAAAGRNMYDVTYEQVEDANAKMPKATREANMKVQKEIQDAVKEAREPNYNIIGKGAAAAVKNVWKQVQPIKEWWHDHFNLDVPGIHKALTCPCFVAQGASDFQVKPEADGKQIVKNLIEGECTDIKFKVYDDLDHLFKPCGGRESNMKMYYEDRDMSREYINDVVAWLNAHRE